MMTSQPQPLIHVLLADDHHIVVRAGICQFLEQTPDIQVVENNLHISDRTVQGLVAPSSKSCKLTAGLKL
jgi:hypothetical protein